MSRKQIWVGILGFGSVGSGVVKLLQKNHDQLLRRTGVDLSIAAIAVRNRKKMRGVKVNPNLLTGDAWTVVNHPKIDIVIELMGGVEPAKALIEAALRQRKYVVTANKELIAKHGYALFDLAKRNGVDLYYEASVAGAIPIIRTLKVGFAPNRITEVAGIINGTTNFMLSEMDQKGRAYAEVLKQAQALGYAEANPAADVKGHDAAFKLAILASIAFHAKIKVSDVACEGIDSLDPMDIAWAKRLGYVIKLIARGVVLPQGLSLNVYPRFVERSHPLANVSGVFNAVFIKGDFIGDAMLYGRGAGSEPTGAAVVSDVLDIVHSFRQNVTQRNLVTEYRKFKMVAAGQCSSRFYLRFEVQDQAGVLAKLTRILGKHKVSVETIEQQIHTRKRAMLVVVTHVSNEAYVQAAVSEIKRVKPVLGCRALIRVGI